MTVSNTTSRNQYTATSGQTVFPYTFEVFDKDDLVVLKNGTTLSEGTDYTVSGVGIDSGGNVTLVVGATAGDIITIYRDMALQRLTDYQTSGDFLAQEVNDDFDRLWLAVQQNEQANDRAIVKPITDAASIDMTLPSAADRANSYLTFDATGAPSVVAAGDPSAPDAITRQEFTGDGSTTNFTLASAPGGVGAGLLIAIDGVVQAKSTYTVTSTTLAFSEAPPINAFIEVIQLKVTDLGEADSDAVSFIPAGSGAVERSVQSKLREIETPADTGSAQGAALLEITGPADGHNYLFNPDINVIEGGKGNVVSGGYAASNNRLLGATDYRIIAGGYDNEMNLCIASVIGGGAHNQVNPTALDQATCSHATIAGGTYHQVLTGNYTTIGGGSQHTFSDTGATQLPDTSTISGGAYHTINGADSATIAGGSTNTIDGARFAFIGGGINHSITGRGSVIAGGSGNSITGLYSVVAGGDGITVAGDRAIAAGLSHTSVGSYSACFGRTNITAAYGAAFGQNNDCGTYAITGGANNTSTLYSLVGGDTNSGGAYGVLSGTNNSGTGYYCSIVGENITYDTHNHCYAGGLDTVTRFPGSSAFSGGKITTAGDAQSHTVYLKKETTSASTGVLTMANLATTMTMASNSLAHVTAKVVGYEPATGDSICFNLEGLVKNTSGTAAFVGSPTSTIAFNDAGAAAWTAVLALNAGGFRVHVVGEVAHTIHWHATVNITEVA